MIEIIKDNCSVAFAEDCFASIIGSKDGVKAYTYLKDTFGLDKIQYYDLNLEDFKEVIDKKLYLIKDKFILKRDFIDKVILTEPSLKGGITLYHNSIKDSIKCFKIARINDEIINFETIYKEEKGIPCASTVWDKFFSNITEIELYETQLIENGFIKLELSGGFNDSFGFNKDLYYDLHILVKKEDILSFSIENLNNSSIVRIAFRNESNFKVNTVFYTVENQLQASILYSKIREKLF